VTLFGDESASCSEQQPCMVRGFFDGDDVYRARFMPPAEGAWTYLTSSNVASLSGLRGQFTVVPASPNNHGPVVAGAPNSTTFSYADGSAFHATGTTVYGMFGTAANVTARTLASLQASPFNKVRIMAFPSGSGPADKLPYVPLDGKAGAPSDLTTFNVRFWRHVDTVVAKLLSIVRAPSQSSHHCHHIHLHRHRHQHCGRLKSVARASLASGACASRAVAGRPGRRDPLQLVHEVLP
jgi:hypothetical protein